MASSEARKKTPAVEGFADYLPADDSFDFGGLFSDDEGGSGTKTGEDKAKKTDKIAGLGIDEEISVSKKARAPRVKLDEAKLLSSKGIPALRVQARNLKLKGKGHEFSDAARLLSMYQLWLDDLFPKARFADALAMVEREGHKASMHKMRMEWINESKPKDETDVNGEEAEPTQGDGQAQPEIQPQSKEQSQGQTQGQAQSAARNADDTGAPTEEEMMAMEEDMMTTALPIMPSRPAPPVADDVPDGDELDELMAEAMAVHGPSPEPRRPPPPPSPPAEEMDKMDDLDALMAEAAAA